jgi:cold shock CspA family protein
VRYQGKITTWHDDKGFGFVTQNGGGHKAFVHISSFQSQTRRPQLGDIIAYELGEDERKRLRN